jgi:hypothetical protein
MIEQTISGTLNGMLPASGGVFANHGMYWHIHLYATIGDTDAVRHTFIDDYRENTPTQTVFPNPEAWGGFPLGTVAPIPLTAGDVEAGDRLVLECWTVGRTAVSTFYWSKIAYGARADRNDASLGSLIDTSSWIDLNISGATSQHLVQAWSNIVAGDENALTLEVLDDGTAHFKNYQGIYFNGVLIGAAGSPGGSPSPELIQDLLNGISMTPGAILYFDGTDWVGLDPGTEAQVLTLEGSPPLPAWEDVGAGSPGSPGGSFGDILDVIVVVKSADER